jgi:hypothetical protein
MLGSERGIVVLVAGRSVVEFHQRQLVIGVPQPLLRHQERHVYPGRV